LLNILELSKKIIGEADDLEVEVEYQQETIGKFALEFAQNHFVLRSMQTACLAIDRCGIPDAPKVKAASSCAPGGGCC
jgi:hypothetical protein